MLNVTQFRQDIIKPTLEHLGMYSQAAENLLIGTAVQESGLRHLRQIGKGPALGVYQIEPATHDDVWSNYLLYRKEMSDRVDQLQTLHLAGSKALIGNLYYATAIARIIYYRRPEPLPEAGDIEALGHFWKAHYNTVKGKGSPHMFKLNYLEYCNG
jgi:hypothetical protein